MAHVVRSKQKMLDESALRRNSLGELGGFYVDDSVAFVGKDEGRDDLGRTR